MAALAPSIGVLLARRALMGIGGAMMWPAILGMTYAALPEGKAGLAGGLILGVAGFGNAVGPLLGGVLTDALSWRWMFFVNLPMALFAVLVTWRFIHQPSRARGRATAIDYARRRHALGRRSSRCCSRSTRRPSCGWGDPRIMARCWPVAWSPSGRSRSSSAAPGDNALVPARRDGQPRVQRGVPRGADACRRCSSPPCSTCRSSCRSCWATRRSRPAPGCCR